jgi:hypothetical protein
MRKSLPKWGAATCRNRTGFLYASTEGTDGFRNNLYESA